MKKKICLCLFLICFLPFVYLADDGKDDVVFYEDDMQCMTNESESVQYITDLSVKPKEMVSHIPPLMLEKGKYQITISYSAAKKDTSFVLNNNGILLEKDVLNPLETTKTISFDLEKDSQEVWVQLYRPIDSAFVLSSVTISCETSFYSDIYLVMLIIIIVAFALFFLSQKDWENMGEERKNKYLSAIAIVCIGVFATYPLFTNIVLHADDLSYHLLRIEGIKDGLLDGQFPVTILPEALEGNGLLNTMYPSLCLYIPALLRICRISLFTSYKVYILLINIATAWIMYLSVKSVGGSKKAALLAAVLYTLCPYRFSNIYARGAVGEVTAMTFFPLFFAGLYHVLAGKREKWHYLAIAMIGLLQSHILSVLLAGMICVVFGALYIVRIIKEKRYIEIIKAAFIAGILNLWYLIPFMMYYLRGSLWSNSLDWSTFEEYAQNIFSLFQTINLESYRSYSLGMPLIICLLIAVFYIVFNNKEERDEEFLIPLLIAGFICVYITTNYFSGWALMNITPVKVLLQKIQFPWRLLTISGCIFAMTGAICLYKMKWLEQYRKGIVWCLLILTLLSTLKTIEIPVYESLDAVISTGHVDKVIGVPYSKGRNLCYPYDWRLGGSNNESIVSQPVLSEEGKVQLLTYQKSGTHVQYSYVTSNKNQYIEVPLLAYKGYVAVDENGNRLTIHKEADCCNRIRIFCEPDGEKHTVSISFQGYWFTTLANIVSLVGVIYLCYRIIRKRNGKFLIRKMSGEQIERN